MHLYCDDVNDAFNTLVDAFHRGEYEAPGFTHTTPIRHTNSRNGPVAMIDEPVTVTYANPRSRVLLNSVRDANPFFHVYEALWMLAGRNDVAALAPYNSRMKTFSDNGRTLNGAYGYRWRHNPELAYSHDGDQLSVITSHLHSNPESRRAVLTMWNVEDDLLKVETSADVCCNLNVMFALRRTWPEKDEPGEDTFLDMTVTNRSNDLLWGMLGANYVHFTILQEYMAARLGVEVGRYHHMSNNLHVYTDRPDWKPEELLEAAPDRWDQRRSNQVRVPLVWDTAGFEQELPTFVEWYSDNPLGYGKEEPAWMEPFLATVARPLLTAYWMYKRVKGAGLIDYPGVSEQVSQVADTHWRTAATEWLQRRGVVFK